MSFKKYVAVMLTLATLVAIGGGAPAQAAKTKKMGFTLTSASVSNCVVNGIAVNENVIATDNAESGETVDIDDPQVPLASTSAVIADQQAQVLKVKKSDEKIAEQKKQAQKNYKSALRLLATIVYCEAGGQCYAGRLAVAAVVMNRVESKGYPNTIHGVLWQPYQFGPIRQGKMARELRYYDKGLYNQPERSGSLKAAKDILAGKYTVKYKGQTIDLKKYHNFNGHLSDAKIRISGHDFA